MARILGIDYGEKRIGLALSDESQQFAFEMDVWSPQEFDQNIAGLIKERAISGIVLGNPLNMSGAQTAKTKEVLAFKEKLAQRVNLPVYLVDERLSSQMAAKIAGTQKNIDALAAQIVLQNYLNQNKNNGAASQT